MKVLNNVSKKDTIKKPKKSKFKAVIYNGNIEPRIVTIDKNKKTFRSMGRQYNFKFEDVMFLKTTGFFKTYYYVFYSLDNPDPLYLIENQVKPSILSSVDYDSILESKVIEKANSHTQTDLSQYLTPKNILIGLAVVGVLIYLVSGGSVT